MRETWLRTDEREDIIASLRMVSSSCDAAASDLSAWKWIVIGTHSALQGAMVLHLSVGNDLLAARAEDAADWLDAHESGTTYPAMKIDDFLGLYRKVRKHEILGFRFKPNGRHGGSIRRLSRFGNQFVHLMPQGWSIELSCMPRICGDCLDVVAQLGEHSLCARWEDEVQRQSFAEVLGQCVSKLIRLHIAYAG